VPGELTIEDCCVWRRGTLESAIVNEEIVNWSATSKVANTRTLPEPQRNGALVVQQEGLAITAFKVL